VPPPSRSGQRSPTTRALAAAPCRSSSGDYRVEAGGTGAGTRVHWRFAATSKRVRDQLVEVTEPDERTLVERDTNSSMVTTWTINRADTGVSSVRVRTTWNGAGGIGGFFERTFAPKGLQRVHQDLLGRLERELH
jgi:Polyketide cyclase / dehydrase and lipid transport